ncbi:MAG: lauroyl acyltransferase, partial [Rhodospirillaceae bacterium]|nr:lauroyl acyltransferase [Rhodospirillaceae bacterium]
MSAENPATVTSNLPPVSTGKRVFQFIQALLAYLCFAIVRLLPLDVVSGFGGWLGRTIGPRLGANRRARRNLERAFPEKTPAEIETIIRGMWDNFGRVAFEFPLLHRLRFGEPGTPNIHVEVHGYENTDQLRDDDKPGIFLSGHFANWELAGRSIILRGIPLHLIYRLPNNPMTVKLLMHRNPGGGEMIPKGARGAKRALQLLMNGEHLGIMADQKLNDGIAIPFFGHDAMTAPALAQFARRFDCPVVPVRVERIKGT